MRALTVRQPWAWAIIHAGKNIENRSWRNRHCSGTVAIHASGASVPRTFSLPRGVRRPAAGELHRSAIIGVVDIVDVVDRHRSPWFGGPLGWVLRNPRPLAQPVRCSGRLGLWELPGNLERQVARHLKTKRNGRGDRPSKTASTRKAQRPSKGTR
jgi:hypothetical protein